MDCLFARSGAAIHAVCRMAGAMDGGADILTPSPIYHVFRKAPPLAAVGRRDVVMTLGTDGRWQLTMESLEAAVTPHSRVLQLCNPHNPNGKVYTKAELEGIADFCLRHDLLICADEVHADLILDEDERHVPIASLSPEVARRTITLQSPSKAFNVAGLNFAVVVIADDELRQRYREATAGKVISHLNPLGYAAAMAAWGGAAMIGWRNRWRYGVIIAMRWRRRSPAWRGYGCRTCRRLVWLGWMFLVCRLIRRRSSFGEWVGIVGGRGFWRRQLYAA